MLLKKIKQNNKGFAMAATLGYMFLIVALTVVLISVVDMENTYASRRYLTVSERNQIDSIAYDFVSDGVLTEQSVNSELFDTVIYESNKNRLFITNKGTTEVRMTVERTDAGKISLWCYDYVKN